MVKWLVVIFFIGVLGSILLQQAMNGVVADTASVQEVAAPVANSAQSEEETTTWPPSPIMPEPKWTSYRQPPVEDTMPDPSVNSDNVVH